MKISVSTTVKSDLPTVWKCWSNPADIRQWNAASDDWHTTDSHVDLRVGGKFSARMEAKNGSMGFNFTGTYSKIIEPALIEYTMDDNRVVSIAFVDVEGGVQITETFDADDEYDIEHQREGWQSILNHFTSYVEAKA